MAQVTMTDDDKALLKRYLSQYYKAKKRQDLLKDRLNRIKYELQHGCGKEPDLPLTIKLSEIEDRISRQASIEAAAILDIMQVLDFLPVDSDEREVMELRHIDHKSWSEIRKTVYFSARQCHRIHESGLKILFGYKQVRQRLTDFKDKLERQERDGY